MLNKFKISSSIILLLLLILQSGGLLFILNLKQSYIKYKVRQELSSKYAFFEKLTLSVSEFNNYKIDDDEILINDKLYDIKSVSFKNNFVELLVINDISEAKIIKIINKIADNDSKSQKDLPDQLIKLLSFDYVITVSDFYFIPLLIYDNNYYSLIDSFKSFNSDIPTPPPKVS